MTFTADKIRNILLAGHGGSGKTALAEAMLFKSGATERMGNTNEGSKRLRPGGDTPQDLDKHFTRRDGMAGHPHKYHRRTGSVRLHRRNVRRYPRRRIGGNHGKRQGRSMPRHHQGVQSRRRSEQGKNARRNLHGSRELRFL